MSETIFVGTYTSGGASDEGIEIYLFDEGILDFKKVAVASLENPSYLCFDSERKYLFAAVESSNFGGTSGGAAAVFSIEGGEVRPVDAKPNYGKSPCHITVDRSGKFVYTANYGEGTISEYTFDNNELYLVKTITHQGKGVNPHRQEAPHMHSVTFTNDEKYLCAADLGIDNVVLYKFDNKLGLYDIDDKITINIFNGSGPRHVLFNETTKCLYVLNELNSTVDVFSYNDNYNFKSKQTISTLPDGCTTENTAAAIKISNDSKFLYISNRGFDSIAAFKINSDGTLTMISVSDSCGNHPRDFSITKSGKYLIVANTHSNNLSVFERNAESGELKFTGVTVPIINPVCVLI